MKKVFIIVLVLAGMGSVRGYAGNPAKADKIGKGDVRPMTDAMFKTRIFNYDVNKSWKFEGNKPVIIDFYATWCGPCRMMSPRLEEVAREYAGKIVVYKVDTDVEQMLSQNLGITSLPTLLFIPVKGKPQASLGLIPKSTLIKYIHDYLSVD